MGTWGTWWRYCADEEEVPAIKLKPRLSPCLAEARLVHWGAEARGGHLGRPRLVVMSSKSEIGDKLTLISASLSFNCVHKLKAPMPLNTTEPSTKLIDIALKLRGFKLEKTSRTYTQVSLSTTLN